MTDHGHGVSPQLGENIFHPFVTTKRDGLGVGLAISRTIVQSYGGTLGYSENPAGGAIEYVNALLRDLPDGTVALGEPVISIDRAAHRVTTPQRSVTYRHLVSSTPLPALLRLANAGDPAGFTSNKVLVFNLGFDRKGPEGIHWMYFPQRELSFYRVGFYDNIFGTDRMSIYVELGYPKDAPIGDLAPIRERVLADLAQAGIVREHRLVSSHSVVLDPAYVHITKGSIAEVARANVEQVLRPRLAISHAAAETFRHADQPQVHVRRRGTRQFRRQCATAEAGADDADPHVVSPGSSCGHW